MTDGGSSIQKRHYIWPPVIRKPLPGDGKLRFACSYCARTVTFTKDSQNNLAHGGIGISARTVSDIQLW